MVRLADVHLKHTVKSEPGKKKGGVFRGAAVVEVFYSSSAMKKKERMKESLNHPISLSHVEPGAKTSKYKPVL